ncbi:hypothetical protein TNCV_1733511 [Trichonephila clavipes]|nr:hypothetical protein TNCV_1733511 [Trichonephila clavipes]
MMVCASIQRSTTPNTDTSCSVSASLTVVLGKKTTSMSSPNENSSIIAFEAKSGLILKENSPPLITRPVDPVTCPLVIRYLSDKLAECVEVTETTQNHKGMQGHKYRSCKLWYK